MLRQICRRGRLAGLLDDPRLATSETAALSLLSSRSTSIKPPSLSVPNQKSKQISLELYDWVFEHLRQKFPYIHHYQDLPHPTTTMVLTPWVQELTHILIKTRNYSISSAHNGNGSISYQTTSGTTDYGIIISMWYHIMTEETVPEVYLLVLPYRPLSSTDMSRNPYQTLPGLKCSVVYTPETVNDTRDMVIIEKTQVIGHIASYVRPKGTFGIHRNITIIVDSLIRGRD